MLLSNLFDVMVLCSSHVYPQLRTPVLLCTLKHEIYCIYYSERSDVLNIKDTKDRTVQTEQDKKDLFHRRVLRRIWIDPNDPRSPRKVFETGDGVDGRSNPGRKAAVSVCRERSCLNTKGIWGIGVARRCSGCTCTPSAVKKNFQA